jgi:hypothetical protein
MRCAGEVFTSGLDDLAAGRADELRVALESNCENDALRLLDKEPDAGAEFKSEMVRAIASKCAELVASEIDRVKKGRFTILNEDDQKTFDRQHDDRLKRRTQAITEFLSSLPERYPSFGTNLFADIRRNVQREIEEKYKSPDIHAAVGAMFSDALNAMSPEVRKKIAS